MTKTISVPEEYYAWLEAHNKDDETMFETLRRLTREPERAELEGILSPSEVDEAERAAEQFGKSDGRFE